MNGKLLDNRYQLEEFIGQGGMALVYKALDQRTHHYVAVKILKPEYNHDEEFLQRFSREALAASKVSHHNIVNLLDVGTEGDYRYIVLEYIEGRTLKDIIEEKGALTPDTAVQIAIRILSALQHMHHNGIIHRDIKPQNILIHSEGHVKVSDFGIARMADSATVGKEDVVMGSVHYFSPEQAQGHEVSAASDIYSVGVVLYEMLTGSVPFDGDTPVAIAMQHVNIQPRPIHILNPDVSPAIERVVLKALENDPKNRYQQAQDMARDLRDALDSPEKSSEKPEFKIEKKSSSFILPHVNGIRLGVEILCCLAVLMVIAVVAVNLYQSISNTVNVPYLVGYSENTALHMIQNAGLSAQVTRVSDPDTPVGDVIRQQPEYETSLKKGDTVQITVSTGPKEQEIPSLYGMNVEEAKEKLEMIGFSLLVVSQRVVSEKPWDTVLEQTPAAGEKLSAGGIVQVVLSGGCVTIPKLTGMTRQEALRTAEELGLRITDVHEFSTDDASIFDIVADQMFSDSNDTKLDIGTKVILGTTGTIVVYTDASKMQKKE